MAKKYIDESGLSVVFAKIKALIATKANASHSHNAATQSAAGYMSAADKKKLDGMASGATAITVDSGLSSNSTNPVQNKVINSALAGKADSGHGHGNATSGAAGFMSAADKSKLDGIAAGANAYTHPAYTARTGVPTADQTPAFGGSFNVTQPVSDAAGHITGMNTRKVTIPNTAASESAAGLMSAADKTKLDGIAAGANAYTHPTTSGNKHIPAGGSTGQILRWSADGTAVWGSDNNTTYNAATQSAQGLMSAADKKKLDGIASGANAYTHPSTHPVSMITGIGVATTDEIDAAIAAL